MFITYWFIVFAAIFFPIFWLINVPKFRKYWLLLACIIFHYRFAGPAGVAPIILLGVITYFAGISNNKIFRTAAIILCVLELAFYKYATFFLAQVLSFVNEDMAQQMLIAAKQNFLPAVAPLAISFFVFEFVHYLMDVQRGKEPIRSVTNFTLFSIFWPSIVSGPVKRFEQFLPALTSGCRQINVTDIQVGTLRIVVGLIKKLLIADNLTGFIDFWQPNLAILPLEKRWLLVVAISLRILFDFSGYSDIAIGFARLMGIKLPENFRWPYLATNLQEFWQRWHISLSTWIRDYIYIPLGGNKHGNLRKIFNGVVAFAICGLWHGAAWNFIFWGIYHGIGLVVSANIKSLFSRIPVLIHANSRMVIAPMGWAVTFMYVSVGWLFFFYPVNDAIMMLMSLMGR
ncbi:MAG: MBOAT family O-acyltransferase [Gammaproteobacteria bacterium]